MNFKLEEELPDQNKCRVCGNLILFNRGKWRHLNPNDHAPVWSPDNHTPVWSKEA